MKPYFSVCIPNYNYEKFIGETIESVLAQSCDDFEIVVADNASTDGSVRKVESFGSSKIRLIRNNYNIGFSQNLDRATQGARGRFLLVLSSDDLMRPDALATYRRVLESLGERKTNAVLTSAFDVVDPRGATTAILHRRRGSLYYETATIAEIPEIDVPREPEISSGIEALRWALRAREPPAAFVSTCYSRKLYNKVEGYHNNARINPDTSFLLKLLAQDTLLVYVPQRLFAYRVHNSNQASIEAAQGALKQQVDAYMHTIEFPESALARTGVSRQELVEVFVERAVVDKGLVSLANGHALKAFRCLAFGLATHPKETLLAPKAYGLAALLGLGPIGTRAAKSMLGIYRSMNT